MGKNKKSRERKQKVDKPNPFDLKFSIKKGATAKGAQRYVSVGKPSAARSKAMEKREKTIGIEYRRQGCANQIVDHRIAERSQLPEEEKASMRFAVLKKKQTGKKSIFNLEENKDNDDGIVLTHRGKALSEVQRFERGEEDEHREFDSDVVALSNFAESEGKMQKFSRKDAISEVISNKKNAKFIRQMAQDDICLDTENIDEKYKLLKSQGFIEKIGDTPSLQNEKVMDDYDEIYQTLLVDGGKKAIPTLSEKQKAEKEAQRLADLEKERMKRMQADADQSDNEQTGVDEEVKKTKKHNKQVSFNIAYDEEGNLLQSLKADEKIEHVGADEEVDDFYDDNAEDDDEDMDDSEDEDDDNDDAEDDDDDEEKEGQKDEIDEDEHTEALNLKIRPDQAKDSSLEIPYTFTYPKKYGTFRDLYSTFFPDQWQILTERLIKCYHPSLKPENKKLMAHLYRFSLRFYDSLAKNLAAGQLQPIINVIRQYQALCRQSAAAITRSLLIYKRNHYRPIGKVVSRPPPSFDLIAFFALVAELYPTSDHFHAVCSPTFAFAIDVLRLSQINSMKSCGIVILLAKMLIKWVQESQRFIPEVINVTRLLLSLAVEKQKDDFLLDPFAYRNVSRKNGFIDVLVVKDKTKKPLDEVMDSLELFKEEDSIPDEIIRLHLLRSLFSLVDLTVDVYDRLKLAYGAIFTSHLQLLQRINKSTYPSELSSKLTELIKKISDKIEEYNTRTSRQRKEIKKIKMIKMLDPVIDDHFDADKPMRGARKNDPDVEIKRLKKMVRNEKKGAIRELRHDTEFLSSAQQKNQQEERAERNYKTKRILSSLQGQESEYKKRKMKKF